MFFFVKFISKKLVFLLLIFQCLQEISIYHTGQISSKFYGVLISKNGFSDLALQSILIVLSTCLLISLCSYIADRCALNIRMKITNSNMLPHVGTKKPVINADQRITDDLKQFSILGLNILQTVIISPPVIVYYSLQLPILHVSIILAYFILSLILIRPWVIGCKKKTVKIDQSEGNYRISHVDILTHKDSILLSQSQDFHSSSLQSEFYSIYQQNLSLFKLQFVVKFLSQFWAYFGSILSFLLISILIHAGAYDHLTDSEMATLISKHSFLCMYLIFRFTTLTGLADDYSKFIAFYQRLLEWSESIKPRKKDHPMFDPFKYSYIKSCRRISYIHVEPHETVKQPDTFDASCDIQITNLSFNNPAIQIENFNLHATFNPISPPVIVLSGPSGCGKSTLFKVLRGILPHHSGSISIPENSIFLPQSPYLLREATLASQLAYPSDNIKPSQLTQIKVLMETLHLSHLLTRQDSTFQKETDVPTLESVVIESEKLSPGETQRLVFLRMVLKKPVWAFMDEPFSALDKDYQTTMLEICQNYGIGVVMICH